MDAVLDIIKNRPKGCTSVDIENIRQILENININIQDDTCRTILVQCCDDYYNSNNIEVIKLLLKSGIDVNIRNNNGYTALFGCCKYKDIEIVKLLIENNANVNLQNNYGETALTYVSIYSYKNDIEIAKLLLKNGADVHIQDNYCKNAIMYALRYVNNKICSLKMSQLLLEYDAEPHDTQDINIFADNIAKLNALS